MRKRDRHAAEDRDPDRAHRVALVPRRTSFEWFRPPIHRRVLRCASLRSAQERFLGAPCARRASTPSTDQNLCDEVLVDGAVDAKNRRSPSRHTVAFAIVRR